MVMQYSHGEYYAGSKFRITYYVGTLWNVCSLVVLLCLMDHMVSLVIIKCSEIERQNPLTVASNELTGVRR